MLRLARDKYPSPAVNWPQVRGSCELIPSESGIVSCSRGHPPLLNRKLCERQSPDTLAVRIRRRGLTRETKEMGCLPLSMNSTRLAWRRNVSTRRESASVSLVGHGRFRSTNSCPGTQRLSPGLRRRFAAAHHVFADAALPDVHAEFERFAADAGCTPTGILPAHLADQISNLARNERSSGLAAPHLPGPEQTKAGR
jgi:hypothetical protein